MVIKKYIFNELIKRGHSVNGSSRVWDISDGKLWYLTPELARGFLKLANYEPYKRKYVDKEIEMIERETKKIIEKHKKNNFNIIDLGCGNGIKAEHFIKSLPNNINARYCPVDISTEFINSASERIKNLNMENIIPYESKITDFSDLGDSIIRLRSGNFSNNVALLFGGTLSTFDVNELLYNLSEKMFNDDILIIGNGLRKEKQYEQKSIDKYRDPIFNKWFMLIMDGLGFKEDEVKYEVRFSHGRVEGFYKVKKDKKVEFKGKIVEFKKDDEIIIATHYKYFEEELEKFCKMYFKEVEIIKDEDYALIVCKK